MNRRTVSNPLAALAAAVVFTAVGPGSALAQADVEVDYTIDGAITAGALAIAAAATLMPVDTDNRWDSELFGGLDLRVRDNFSASAAKLSDALITATIAAPVLLQLDRGLDEEAGKRALLYGETMAVSLALNAAFKYTVRRPRPYNYHPDPRVAEYAADAGKDGHLSFYSGHSALSFTAAVSGSYLFALGSSSTATKAAVWGMQLALATATANLRVRAGKHYYSDVVVGAIVGSAIGFAVPALHADGGVYQPSGAEIGAMIAGIAVGAIASQLLPLDDDILVPVSPAEGTAGPRGVRPVPIATARGAGIGIAGQF